MLTQNWNLSDIYNSNEEFLKDYNLAKNYLEKLEKFKDKLDKQDNGAILEYFKLDTEFSIILEKLAVYAHCKNDDNGKLEQNVKNYNMVQDLFAQINEKLSFVKVQLSKLDDDYLNKLAKDTKFADFDIVIKDLIKDKPHTLSQTEETLMAGISSFESCDDVYSVLSDIEMEHGSYVNEEGKEVKLTTGNYNLLMKNPSSVERAKIQEAYLEKYANLNLTFANLYLSHVKYMNFLAKTYHFNSALDMLTFEEDVTPEIMKNNIKFVSSKIGLLGRYFELKKRILKLDSFKTSDISADIVKTNSQNVTYEDSINDIYNSYAVLGKDYQESFLNAVNNGWIDVFPRENKASGGYTISTFSVHPYILLNFDGTAYWKSAITHEFGHAMHSYYSAKNQPYSKHDYTIFVAEVASLTNEILLTEHNLKNAKANQEKMQIIADFLALFYLNVYNSSMLAEFELFVHQSLDEHVALTGTDLNNKYIELCNKYFDGKVELTKNFEADWSRKSHIFSDYYLYKYSTGLISACCIAQKILADNSGEYIKKYKQFLSLGGSKDPISSLKTAEVDILSEEPYNFAFNMFENYLNKLENISKEEL